MSQFPDFDLYDTLHLAKDATAEAVRTHYVRIMRRNHIDHPDFLGRIRDKFPLLPEETATEYDRRVEEIAKKSVQRFNIAYEVLSDPAKRLEYDRHIGISARYRVTPKQARASEAPRPQSPVRKTSKSENRHFFNRGSQSAQGSRRTRSESESTPDKYCFWKQ